MPLHALAESAIRRGLHPNFRLLLFACSSLATTYASSAAAQSSSRGDPGLPNSGTRVEPAKPVEDGQIIVIGAHTIIASLRDVPVERTYDDKRVASYAVSTVGELTSRIFGENGDDAPTILVNGVPVSSIGDIADFPVEAVQRIEALPRGAASRVGGQPGERAYNIVLKPRVRSTTLTASKQISTEGHASSYRGELLLTLVKGSDRVNVTFRSSDTDPLFEADRAVTPHPQTADFSALGTIFPLNGTEIDPVFSALAGTTVGTIALPAGLARPQLAQLLPGANTVNPGNFGAFRTLRGAGTTYELNVTGSKSLAAWLTLSFSGRLNWNDTTSYNGLPAARFLIPSGNPYTPFSRPVVLAVDDPSRPLLSSSRSNGRSLSVTLNAFPGKWRASLTARTDTRNSTSSYDLVAPLTGGFAAYDPAIDPFAGRLAGTIPVTQRVSRSISTTKEIVFEAGRPLFILPAGPIRLNLVGGVVWTELDGNDPTNGHTVFSRRDVTARAGLSIPVIGSNRAADGLGTVAITLDAGFLNSNRSGGASRYSAGLNWQVRDWLRFFASHAVDRRAIAAELVAAPSIITPNVSYFDPLTGRSALVSVIYGGAGYLPDEEQRINRFSASFGPFSAYDVLLDLDYVDTRARNRIGALPLPTGPVIAAFPERFVRDGSGQLILVDARTISFDRQSSRELRGAIDLSVPLGSQAASFDMPARPRQPAPALQLHISYTLLLDSSIVIRPALGRNDLLKGEVGGLGGGQQRHTVDGNFAFTRGSSGIAINAAWRGPSYLAIGTAAAPERITFGAYAKFDLRAYADLGVLLPRSGLAKGTRVTLAVVNLAGTRQSVKADNGLVPLSFQQIFRDAVGRTISLELRKVF